VLEFTEEYEALYYCCMVSRLHFCRQSIHGLSHLAQDVACLGPSIYSSQWTLEHTISNLGQEIKQPLKPYANLANCGLQHSQLAALHAILPDLAPDDPVLPRGAVDLRGSYILLRVWDRSAVSFDGEHADTICIFLVEELGQDGIAADWEPRYMQWARLHLLNMQIARCAWKETSHTCSAQSICCSCNMKVGQTVWHCAALDSYAFPVYVWGNLLYRRSAIFLSKQSLW
jgi:hypothetical protein